MTKALVVRFRLLPGAASGFDKLVAATVAEIRRKEPGTLVYAVHDVPDDPDCRIFYELYADEQAFQEHEAQPHTQHFLRERSQYVADFTVDFARTLVASGIPALNAGPE